MRYLVTGGAGFIGSHLVDRLLADGHDVTVLDDLSTGRAGNLPQHRSLQIIRDTVESQPIVDLAVSQCDAVFHLASAVGVKLIADEPVRTIRTIIRGTEVVLEAANRFGKPVLITSSSEVYGRGTRVPFREDDDITIGPTTQTRWCYAYAKGIDEFLGLAYGRQFGLPVTIVRLFNTVGPRQVPQYGMVLPRFVRWAIANEPLLVTGSGEQTRCFCHVSDVSDALVRLIGHPQAAGQVFNLGGSEEISMNALAERVIAAAGSASQIELVPYERIYGNAIDDLARRVPDVSRIESAIGFSPRMNLDEIISSIIRHERAASVR